VLKKQAKEQEQMGESLTLDSILNSIDAEVIATGDNAKGGYRGAIIRHGRYTLWGFEGPVSDMTDDGKRLFINTVIYASHYADSKVLEKRNNNTRDDLFEGLEYAKRVPGYLNTIKDQYLPKGMEKFNHKQIEDWLIKNRSYLRVDDGRRFLIDEFAKSLKIPNHKKEFLEKCIDNLKQRTDVEQSIDALVRYTTGVKDFGDSFEQWQNWYDTNKDFLYFSDCEGFVFKIDQQAKEKNVPTEKLRNWSSETIDYRHYSNDK
jgi:hypothetical protein